MVVVIQCILTSRQIPAKCTLWLFNIAMENGPFIVNFPIKTSIYKGFSMAMLNNKMVNHLMCPKRQTLGRAELSPQKGLQAAGREG